MDTNNWRPAPDGGGGEPTMDAGDWRSQLQPNSRRRIVNEIMDTLKRHVPFSGQEGLQELKKIAVRFEEKICTSATSQPDYLKKISLKMLTIEMKSRNTMTNSLPLNSGNNSDCPPDTGSLGNQGQLLPIPMAANQAQARQQLLSQNIQNNMAATAVQGSANLVSALPTIGGLPPTIPNVAGQNSSLQDIQNVSGISQNSIGNSVGQSASSNSFANTLWQMPGRQQVVLRQQQSQNPQQQYLYQQQQLQRQLVKQKCPQGSIPDTKMQSQLQQQQTQHQQNQIAQSSQLRSSQQSVMQHSVMKLAPVSGFQQNQQSSVQQSTQPMLQQNPQAVLRQQQPSIIRQQKTHVEQQQLMGQQPSSTIVQQNQIIGQQDSIQDMQQQQQRLLSQQNSLTNLQQQQQQLMSQQNNLSNMQQQQLLVNQCVNSSMQTTQHSVHMLQQSKIPLQQQNHQSAATLLPTQGQQSEPQQRSLSQIQSQPGQLQQQGLQQSNSLRLDMQPRLQTSGPLFQSLNMIDQQKQISQSQRDIQEASLTSLDSKAQTGNATSGDWQEEIYQKIKVMKEAYLAELTEMDQKIAGKLQQHDSLPQQPKNEQLEKLKLIKTMLERIVKFLQVPKSSILPNFKEMVGAYKKHIVYFLNSSRPQKLASLQQEQGQQNPPPHIQSMQQSQQSQSHVTQAHPIHENHMNPRLQSMNFQSSSVATVQQNNVTSLQHNSLSALSGVSTTSQSMISSLQARSTIDSDQGSALSASQEVPVGSLQQNLVNAPQQANINSLFLHSGMNVLQGNLTPLQSNSNMRQNQHLKQQEQQTQQKQQFQPCHMQQQQRQLLHQQNKQQQNVQLQPHQMPQLHQTNNANDLKMRQQMGANTAVFQQHYSVDQCLEYHHQQLNSGAQFPISSSQLLQAASPQMPQHSSPQIDQQNLLTFLAKGTPLQSTSSPFVVPPPSTPIAPSPISVESEKVNSGVSALSDAGTNAYEQAAGAVTRGQSLSIGTPGISASPLLAEFICLDGNHGNASPVVSGKSSVTEQPLERVLKAVKSMSPATLSASVSDIDSVISMMDTIAGSAPDNGSRTAVGEDLVAMTKWRLQARNMSMQDTNIGARKMRRYTSAMPLNVVSSAGSANYSFKHLTCSETSDSESTATSSVKRRRFQANHTLLEEIVEINQRLIDTVVCVSDEDVDPTPAAAITGEGGEGTIVLCSFSAVALSPYLKSQYGSAQMSPIQPLRLLVPTSYPSSSPILLDKFPIEVSMQYGDLSLKAKSRFSISLRNLSQPLSLGEIAKTWDACARAVMLEYAQRSGGGSFSSIYGMQEDRLSDK
ncbi:mediator of RNA polymerase II transcription subunit 15a-like [Rhododendron vialii]|uniref:mediator of RNA polymerase II transcription subunit 15a-like n=1 Tax=Rhododendron vialii TaxID=182163 RepID=UPI00265F58D1|nr:mediator of RNA polymerase II transcription subunit 15a-like [Rhododendron vialii]XP_058204914.1 mediator of RNA polymerase II transcription subunit 15a-like [Rhododendron vialii]